MEKIDMNGYGSHLPLFNFVFKAFEVKKVIEFGCGLYSTPFFQQNNCELISIEMQELAWANQVSSKLGIEVIPAIGPQTFKKLKIDWNCDLAFIDGHIESRPECVNFMFANAKIIVAHDFNKTNVYGWNRINKPDGFHQLIFGIADRSTACFIRKDLLIENF